ncbi:hypothetical protein Dimus_014537 [Dionaea muscipula]
MKSKNIISDKIIMLRKSTSGSVYDQTTDGSCKKLYKRFLVIVNVVGSPGPLRFMVNEDDLVGAVIDATLKQYAREARLPALGSNPDNFLLYTTTDATALNAWEAIGSSGGRNFIMCKKVLVQKPNMTTTDQFARSEMMISDPHRKKGMINAKWKAWLNRSLSLN